MISRGIESNPWNVPQEDLAEWTQRFLNALPNESQVRLFNNIPDDESMSLISEATTMLMDISGDDDNDDEEEEEIIVQQQEISSSTPTLATLNVINSMENKMKNVWILQPALNSVYNAMDPVPAYHFKNSTGAYQMNFRREYDNALMTPLVQNICTVPTRDVCSMKTIQTSLFHLMTAMNNYSISEPSEKESLLTNFNYLAQLVTDMERGLKAQREWNNVIQSLGHRSGHFQSNVSDVESIDLPYLVKSSTQRCSETIMDDQIPLTTLFDQYQRALSPKILENNNHWTEQEITAHKMHILISKIQEMMNEINNENISFV